MVLPAEVRRKYGLGPGDELELVDAGARGCAAGFAQVRRALGVSAGGTPTTLSKTWFVLDSFAILALLGAEKGSRPIVPADRTLTLAAARFKAAYRISYADAFCAALSQISGFPVVTGDPEFLELEGLIFIRWIG